MALMARNNLSKLRTFASMQSFIRGSSTEFNTKFENHLKPIKGRSIQSLTSILHLYKYSFSKVFTKKTQNGTNVLSITWSDSKEEQYPAVWLRDNCQCPKCYHASAFERLHLMRNVDPEIKFKSSVLASNNEVCLCISWC